MLIERIVSGGQTGADRAALDWALEHEVPHGGWCPAGRRAEDGAIEERYRLRETPGRGYVVRTKLNVRESDATVIFSLAPELSGGSAATQRFAMGQGKPWLHVSQAATDDPAGALRRFVKEHCVRVLNVAGPRESGEPGIVSFVREVLEQALLEDDDDEES